MDDLGAGRRARGSGRGRPRAQLSGGLGRRAQGAGVRARDLRGK